MKGKEALCRQQHCHCEDAGFRKNDLISDD